MLCMDEKSSVQALDRTQPSLPIKQGRAQTMTHDYKRHGTATLFAALDVLTGRVIGQCLPRHRHTEFLKFLRTIDREVPDELAVHLICDNYATHKHESVRAWLDKHPRFQLHFTPTSSSWLNLVERWFRELTDKALRRGVFTPCPTSSPKSRTTSPRTTTTPNHSYGPPPPTTSSPKSPADASRSKRSTNDETHHYLATGGGHEPRAQAGRWQSTPPQGSTTSAANSVTTQWWRRARGAARREDFKPTWLSHQPPHGQRHVAHRTSHVRRQKNSNESPFAAGCYCGGGGGTAPPHPPGGAGCGMAPPPTTHCNPGETIPYGCPIIGAPY